MVSNDGDTQYSIPFHSDLDKLNTATKSKARKWNNNFEARINIGAYGSGLLFTWAFNIRSINDCWLLDVRVCDSPTPFYFTIQFQCMHLLLFFVQNFQLFILLCSLCIAIFVRMNEERGLCFDCELKFNQYNMARIFSPFECASCNEPPHTLILSVAFFTTRFGYAAISGVSLVSPAFTIPTAASLSLHVAIQLQYRFGFLHLHEAHLLASTFSFSSKCRKKQ